jgi:hypothetical protein
LLCALVGGRAEAAARPVGSAEVFAGGGYDTNLFLQVAAQPDSPAYRPYSGGFARLAPAATGALAGAGVRLELRYGADIRQTIGSGTLFMQDAQLGFILAELGPFGALVAATAGRFDATIDSGLRFTSYGGAAQLGWHGEEVRALADYRIARRVFGAPASVGVDDDLTQTGELRVAFAPRPSFQVAASAAYLDLRSTLAVDATAPPPPPAGTTAVAQLTRAHGGLDATFIASGRLSLLASAWAGTQRTAGAESDRQVGGSAAVVVRASSALDLVARYDFLFDWAAGTDSGFTLSYQRQIATVGVTGYVVASRRALVAAPWERQQAPEIQPGRVLFKLRAPHASAVTVIGSWNDWNPARVGQRLQRTRDPAMWEAWVAVPPGDHRYHFLVDGRPVRPVDAPHYRSDDFGGEDGLVEVPP